MFKSLTRLINVNVIKKFPINVQYQKILMMFSTKENNTNNTIEIQKDISMKNQGAKKPKKEKENKKVTLNSVQDEKEDSNKSEIKDKNSKTTEEQKEIKLNSDTNVEKNVEQSNNKTGITPENDQNNNENSETEVNESDSKSKTEVTTELLCKLIGSKHYDYNENIKLDKLTIVRCYNENDISLGDRTLQDILKEAQELKKDVILRNDKANPPVVKVMRYKIELAKRLLRKLSKDKKLNITEAKQTKIVYVGLNSDLNDVQTKIKKWRLLLNHFSHITVKVICDLDDKQQVIQANDQLNKIADLLSDVGRINIAPRKNIVPKNQLSEVKEEEIQLINVLTNEEEKNLSQEAKDVLQDLEDKNIDLSAKNFVEMELESMLIDTSGINYELLLSNLHMEDILSGLENKKFFKKADQYTQPKEEEIKDKKRVYDKQKKSVKDDIKNLERELLKEVDLSKRLYKKKKLESNYIKYQDIKTSIIFRSMILKEVSLMKTKLAENPNAYD